MSFGFTESVVERAALGMARRTRLVHFLRHASGRRIPRRRGSRAGGLRAGRAAAAASHGACQAQSGVSRGGARTALRKLTRPEGATLEARNRALHRMLVDGVTVEYRTTEGEIRGAQIDVIDFADAGNNDWLAVNQFTVVEQRHQRRPDIVLFVNGLPLAIIELKNAADEDATIWSAYEQIQTYKAQIPAIFATNELMSFRMASRPASGR